MAECLVGDLTPLDGVPKAEKSRRERSTMDFLTSSLLPPNPSSSSDSGSNANNNDDPRTLISSAWAEYEADTTPEARFVHDVDKLELLLQMVEYERRGDGAVDLGEFVHVARGIRLREMKAWCREVLRERRAFWEAKGKVPSCVADVEEILREGEEDGEEVREGEEEADGGKGGEAGKGP
ncbi:MAG: hypothetical protein LQ345_004447 [Seirophora villosa]|nr:MAG: hypothetical protein LQ345_004447 [Seirophora villosa]